jgi:hypothetical protein
LSPQQVFQGPYLLAPLSELSFPYVQIKAPNKVHNFSSQYFSIRGHLSPKIYIERSCCCWLRE